VNLAPLLSVRGFAAKRGWRAVVESVVLRVCTENRIYLHGENGSGKTTLLESLLGLLPACADERSWKGRPGHPYEHGAFAAGEIVYVRQNGNLFPSLTLRGNFELGSSMNGKDIDKLSRSVLRRFPELEGCFERWPRFANAGQRQLAAGLRFLAHDPLLLVLDEPTAGLSGDVIQRFYETLDEWLAGKQCAVLLTEQHERLAKNWCTDSWRLVDRVLVVESNESLKG
jgi:urea transport system ATP-binding protein